MENGLQTRHVGGCHGVLALHSQFPQLAAPDPNPKPPLTSPTVCVPVPCAPGCAWAGGPGREAQTHTGGRRRITHAPICSTQCPYLSGRYIPSPQSDTVHTGAEGSQVRPPPGPTHPTLPYPPFPTHNTHNTHNACPHATHALTPSRTRTRSHTTMTTTPTHLPVPTPIPPPQR